VGARRRPSEDTATAAQLIDVVHGSEGVWHAWWLHADPTATREVCAIVPDLAPFLAIAAGTAASEFEDLQTLLTRFDVAVRLILPVDAVSPVTRSVVDSLVDAGVQVRLGDAARWFFVSGDRIAVAPLRPDDRGEVPVGVFRGELLGRALRDLFELRWAHSAPWAASGADEVLRLLAGGLSDEDVAVALGTSVRTVRRRVAEAMDEYGAASRFELGYRYAQAAPER